MAAAVQLPPLGPGAGLEVLRLPVARRRARITARRRAAPVVAERAQTKGAVRHVRRNVAALVLGDAAMVPGLGRARLLRVQRRREGVDLALELSNAAVGLLLALSRRRRGDACAACFRASLAGEVGAFLVAADLRVVSPLHACNGDEALPSARDTSRMLAAAWCRRAIWRIPGFRVPCAQILATVACEV
jgi:hypothetical protein